MRGLHFRFNGAACALYKKENHLKNLNTALCALFIGCGSLYGADAAAALEPIKQGMREIIARFPAEERGALYDRLNAAADVMELAAILRDINAPREANQ